MFLQNKQTPAFGLDLGDQTIKLIGLVSQGNNHVITNYNTQTLPEKSFIDGKIVQEDEIIHQIHKLINTAQGGQKLKTKFVHSCLPDSQTFVKLITIPEMTEKEIPEAVRWASEHHIPMPIDSIYIDWQVVSHNAESNHINILIGAAPKDLSENYTNLLKKAGLIPLSLEIEATAIARALCDTKTAEQNKISMALIDIGATRTGLTVVADGSIQFNSRLPFSGNDITKTISTTLDLSKEQAEQSKIVCGFDNKDCDGALRTILDDKLTELIDNLKAAFAFYEKNFDQSKPVERLILCGGGAHFSGIDRVLTEKLGLTTTIGNPLLKCSSPSEKFSSEAVLSYTTAIGLALKIFE